MSLTPPTWLIGNLSPIIRLGYPKALQQWAQEYGPIYKVWQGGNVLIICEDPAAARTANLHNHDRPPIFLNFVGEEHEFDNAGMLLAKGKYWQSLKHAWQAMFHPTNLRAYTTAMNASAEQLGDVLAAKAGAGGEEAEIWRLFGCLTMDVVGSTAFGIELQTVKDHAKVAAMDVSKITFGPTDSDAALLLKSLAVQFAFAGPADSLYVLLNLLFPHASPVFRFLGTYLPDAGLHKQLQARRQMRSVCYKLISKARQSCGSGGGGSSDGGGGGSSDRSPPV